MAIDPVAVLRYAVLQVSEEMVSAPCSQIYTQWEGGLNMLEDAITYLKHTTPDGPPACVLSHRRHA